MKRFIFLNGIYFFFGVVNPWPVLSWEFWASVFAFVVVMALHEIQIEEDFARKGFKKMGLKTWQPKQKAMLKKLWKTGHSSQKICDLINEHYGTEYSRNAIIGVAHRMGLPNRTTVQTTPKNSKPIKKQKKIKHKTTIDVATVNQCRNTSAESSADMPVCGRRVVPGRSYCEDCCDIVFQTWKPMAEIKL